MTASLGPACGTDAGGAEARADDVPRAVPRALPIGDDGDAGDRAIQGLGLDLYKRLSVGNQENLVFSPYSVLVALAMTRNGATGETRAEMDQVLHAGSGDELATANALWGQQDTPFERPFLEVLAAQYGAGMKLVDYKTDAERARGDINTWASDRTNGRIVDLLPPDSLDSFSRLVLTNAIYFKAPWLKRFSPVGEQPFTKADGTAVSAPAMSTSKVGTFGSGNGWRAAEIPYLGNDLSMVLIVPDDLATFESTVDGPQLAEILGGTKGPLATLQMPKFSFRTEAQLKPPLAELGMPRAFREDAEFDGMTKAEQLRIKDVFHQAFIAVDEEGTEAAAATAVVGEAVSGPSGENLVVDRPFLFVIKDVPTGAVLFFGRVTDPTAS